MVKRLWYFFDKEIGSLNEAALLLAVSMFLAQILALVRDRLLAATYGAGTSLDIYYSAFRLPDLLYVTIASFVSVAVLIPFIIERLEKGEEIAARNFLSAVFSLFVIVMVVSCLAGFILMPWLAPRLAPGFDQTAQNQLIQLARILLLSPLLLGLSNLLGSITQAYRKFFVYSLSPIFYNIGIIAGIIFFVPWLGLSGLVWGVILGALLHLGVQLPTLWSIGFWPRWSIIEIKSNLKLIGRLIAISWPRTITLSASQLVIMALLAIASYFGRGAISVFNFAINLQSVPLSIVGISYSVAAFPILSKFYSRGHLDKFIEQISSATRQIIFWSIPVTVMFIVLRAQIVRVILGSGYFDWTATRLTAACLALFALSVFAQNLIFLLVRGYYASGKTTKPLIINLLSSFLIIVSALVLGQIFATNQTLKLLLVNLLRVGDLPDTAILMLPLAYSLGMIFNCLVLIVFFARDYHWRLRPILISANQVFWASVIGGLAAYYLLNILSFYLSLETLASIFVQGFIAGIAGLTVNLLVLKLFNNQELAELIKALKHKFWKAEPLIPEQLEL